MTSESLRELLHDRVADETTIDLSGRAWRAGRRVRRRRGLVVVGGVAAGAVAASGVVAWVDSTPPRDDSIAPSPAMVTSAGQADEPDATYEGAPVWFSPSQVEERALPFVDGQPRTLLADDPCVYNALVARARVAIAAGDEVRVWSGAGGTCNRVDISRLDEVTKPNGYRVPPTSPSMLSPDGRYLMFPQDGAVAVYDLATGDWYSTPVGRRSTYGATWLDDRAVAIPADDDGVNFSVISKGGPSVSEADLPTLAPGFDTGDAQAFGPTRIVGRSNAQAWGMGAGVPNDAGFGDNEFVAFETRDGLGGVLSMTSTIDGDDSRFKECCPVAGWLDEQTLVYESRQDRTTLVAWTVGTHEFRRVASIWGAYDVASYADLSRP